MTKKTKTTLQVLFLLFLIVGTVYVIRDANRPAEYRQTEGQIFGTTYHVTYSAREDLSRDIVEAMNAVDRSLSTFNPKSTISLINTNRSRATDTLFREVFRLARHVSTATDGAFDITVAPLVNAWGFGFKNRDNVTPQQIDSLLQLVGYNKVRLRGNLIEKDRAATMLDCSGIAKGYGSDCVARALERKGVKDYMIEIGGEIRARGRNSEGKIWTVGIVEPQDSKEELNNELHAVIRLTDSGLATSGNYRNFYYKGGRKYAHTIDPHTGRPVQHSILSSTVTAPTCAEADAFATAFMVMGLDKARTVLKQNPELKAYFIYSDNQGKEQVWMSPELRNDIVK